MEARRHGFIVHGCTVCTAVTAPGRHKDGTSDGSRFLMLSPNDYRHYNLHWKSLGSAIDCTSIDFGVDLSIAKLKIGAVDGLDGRVSEIGVNSLTNCIRSRSNFKRYVFVHFGTPSR
jgi:hypothetical protein